jgi:hypothetical protein
MNGGAKTALLISCATLAGCSTSEPVKVRAIADPSAALSRGDALAAARGQFMLGNIGLALEGFRKAQREDPYSPAVMSGIGDCYAAMGRYDIAESSYEVALSLAPRDHRLLLGLASVLERGGDLKRAKDIRDEAARFQQTEALLAAQAASRAKMLAAATAKPPVQQGRAPGTVTAALPPARPAAVAAAKQPRRKTVHPAVTALKVAAAVPVVPVTPGTEAAPKLAAAPATAALLPVAVKAIPAAPVPAAVVPAAEALLLPPEPHPPIPPAPAVTPAAAIVPVHAARPPAVPVRPAAAAAAAVAAAATIPTAAAAPRVPAPVPSKAALPVLPPLYLGSAPIAPRIVPAVLPLAEAVSPPLTSAQPLAPAPRPTRSSPPADIAFRAPEPAGPRLQRLSNGEVALLTTKDASWRAPMAVRALSRAPAPTADVPHREASLRTASAGGVQWVPLRMARASASVQVLNAARSDGLAGSARNVLFGRGWRSVAIGNAGAARRTSVVFYPRERAKLGRRLAAQFGVRAQMVDSDGVVLVLGRDAIGRIASQRRS